MPEEWSKIFTVCKKTTTTKKSHYVHVIKGDSHVVCKFESGVWQDEPEKDVERFKKEKEWTRD